ncbi:MAG TPA: hypothetical protein VET88_00275 [Gammaproteobacteria bacterium]|nr:hypothetical protein [Gammaproteobacteria bacterium]
MKKLGWLLASGWLLTASGSVTAAGPLVEPIFTRYAGIYQSPTLDTRVEFFKDKPMEEMDDFDGYGVTLDFTYPINDLSQIEILAPVYTNGDGDYKSPGHFADGQSVDVEGYGGVREFPSLIYERRFPWAEDRLGMNVAWLAGAGKRVAYLDVDYHGQTIDRFNHSGYNYQVGLKLDDDIRNGAMSLLGNLRYVFFRDTDDINVTGDDVSFEILYATGAVLFNDYGKVTPVLETILEYDFEDFTAFSLAPEVIYTFTDQWDVKLGAPFRLTSDGQKYAAELELTYRF